MQRVSLRLLCRLDSRKFCQAGRWQGGIEGAQEGQAPLRKRRLTVFADKQRLYLLMEYVPGGELFKRLREASLSAPALR